MTNLSMLIWCVLMSVVFNMSMKCTCLVPRAHFRKGALRLHCCYYYSSACTDASGQNGLLELLVILNPTGRLQTSRNTARGSASKETDAVFFATCQTV